MNTKPENITFSSENSSRGGDVETLTVYHLHSGFDVFSIFQRTVT